MVPSGIDWQDALSFSVLALAAGWLVSRAYRAAKRQQQAVSCGACPANPENRAASDCCAGRGAPVNFSELQRPPPPS